VTKGARREYAAALRARYVTSTKTVKGALLTEYCRTTGCHRKAAIRALRASRTPSGRRPGRPPLYDGAIRPALQRLWEVGDRACGKLLAPVLPVLVAALERHGALRVPAAVRDQLLRLSPATIDRLLQPVRRARGRQPRRPSPSSGPLKRAIPVRTWSDWTGVRPGALQGDLVLHCGERTEGFFLTTLVTIDVATGWTELEPVWGASQKRVGSAIDHIRRRLPFPLREWHTDNGSEFLNHALLDYCHRHGIRVTRGRDYQKNDQAWVEQRNWLAIRRLVGHDRLTSHRAHAVLHELYRHVQRHLNFFRPLRKVLSKQRRGARFTKHYDRPQTPYQRVLASGVLPAADRRALETQFLALNPATLSADVARALNILSGLADTPPRTMGSRVPQL
jgi:hypothetical protein